MTWSTRQICLSGASLFCGGAAFLLAFVVGYGVLDTIAALLDPRISLAQILSHNQTAIESVGGMIALPAILYLLNFLLFGQRGWQERTAFLGLVVLLGALPAYWVRSFFDIYEGAYLDSGFLTNSAEDLCFPVCLAAGVLLRRKIIGLQAETEGRPTCSTCGYDLTGNVSGTCSECGQRIHDTFGNQRGSNVMNSPVVIGLLLTASFIIIPVLTFCIPFGSAWHGITGYEHWGARCDRLFVIYWRKSVFLSALAFLSAGILAVMFLLKSPFLGNWVAPLATLGAGSLIAGTFCKWSLTPRGWLGLESILDVVLVFLICGIFVLARRKFLYRSGRIGE